MFRTFHNWQSGSRFPVRENYFGIFPLWLARQLPPIRQCEIGSPLMPLSIRPTGLLHPVSTKTTWTTASSAANGALVASTKPAPDLSPCDGSGRFMLPPSRKVYVSPIRRQRWKWPSKNSRRVGLRGRRGRGWKRWHSATVDCADKPHGTRSAHLTMVRFPLASRARRGKPHDSYKFRIGKL